MDYSKVHKWSILCKSTYTLHFNITSLLHISCIDNWSIFTLLSTKNLLFQLVLYVSATLFGRQFAPLFRSSEENKFKNSAVVVVVVVVVVVRAEYSA